MLINQVSSVRDTSFAPGQPAPVAPATTSRAAPPKSAEPSPVGEAQLNEAVAAANESVAMHSNSIEFSIDAQHGTTIVKVVDKNTGQIIRQMPSREMVELAKALDQTKVMLIRRTA